MLGLMQDRPLDVGTLMCRVEGMFGHKRVLTATATGETDASWAEVVGRARRLAGALDAADVPRQARVATFAWNSQRHVELYLAVPSSGRVLHTVNHRLFAREIIHIVNDAEDDIVFVDRSLLPTVWPLVPEFRSVRRVVVMDDGADEPMPDDDRVVDYEQFLASATEPAEPVSVDERDAASLCYTSGTTGRPRACSTAIARACCTPCSCRRRRLRDRRARRRDADRADVPRQRLGPAVRRDARRRRPGPPGPRMEPDRLADLMSGTG